MGFFLFGFFLIASAPRKEREVARELTLGAVCDRLSRGDPTVVVFAVRDTGDSTFGTAKHCVTPTTHQRGDGTPISVPGLLVNMWEVFLSSCQLP